MNVSTSYTNKNYTQPFTPLVVYGLIYMFVVVFDTSLPLSMVKLCWSPWPMLMEVGDRGQLPPYTLIASSVSSSNASSIENRLGRPFVKPMGDDIVAPVLDAGRLSRCVRDTRSGHVSATEPRNGGRGHTG